MKNKLTIPQMYAITISVSIVTIIFAILTRVL